VYEKVVGRARQRRKKGVSSWVRLGLNRAKDHILKKERTSLNGNERDSYPVPRSRTRIAEINSSSGRDRRRRFQSTGREDLSRTLPNRKEMNGREDE
jgi:hypothetical protein